MQNPSFADPGQCGNRFRSKSQYRCKSRSLTCRLRCISEKDPDSDETGEWVL